MYWQVPAIQRGITQFQRNAKQGSSDSNLVAERFKMVKTRKRKKVFGGNIPGSIYIKNKNGNYGMNSLFTNLLF